MDENAEFHKVQQYLEDILILHGLSKNLSSLLFEMRNYLNVQNQLVVNAFVKKDLALKTNMSKGTIDNAFSKLNEVGLLVRIERGVYNCHAILFNMKDLLKGSSTSLTITYTTNNRIFKED